MKEKMGFHEQKLLEGFHFSQFIIYFWYYLTYNYYSIFFGGYFIIHKQILKIIELDIKGTIHFNEDKELVYSETSCSGTQFDG